MPVMQDMASIFLEVYKYLVKRWLTEVTSSIYDSMILQQCVSHQVDHRDHPSWRWMRELQHT